MRRVVLLSLVPVLAMIGAGCRHDGRTLRPARPDQNVSISTTSMPPALDGGSQVTNTSAPATSADG